MSAKPEHADYAWTDPEGREVRVRVECPSTHTFVYEDGSELIVTQDADGNREYRIDPWLLRADSSRSGEELEALGFTNPHGDAAGSNP